MFHHTAIVQKHTRIAVSTKEPSGPYSLVGCLQNKSTFANKKKAAWRYLFEQYITVKMKNMGRIPDEMLIQRLQFGDSQEVDAALLYLHKQVYQMVVRFVAKYKGVNSDAEDVFQDGLVALYKLAKLGKLMPSTNVEAYLFSICKNLWFKQLRKKQDTVELSTEVNALPALDELPLYGILSQEKQSAIGQLLLHFGEDCQKVLVAYYYDRLRMVKIAEMMGYANEQVAKNKKADCMKKLKNLLAEAPIFSKNLID
jgi:RNA polymerase sigma factor (sigma-70 family)